MLWTLLLIMLDANVPWRPAVFSFGHHILTIMFFNWDRSAVMVAVHSSMLIKKKDPMAGCFGKFGYHPAVLISEASVM